MRRLLFVFSFAIWMLTLSACSTFSVAPASQNLVWKNGHGFLTTADKNAQMSAALTRQDQESLQFYVKIKNRGKKPILVSSESFQLQGSGLENGVAAADDPESMIAADEREIQNNKQQAELSDTSMTADSMSSLAFDLDHDKKDRDQEDRKKREDNRDHNTAIRNVGFYTQQKKEVASRYLRKTTLAPGQTIKGLVEFSVSLQKGPIRLVFDSGHSNLALGYRSTKQSD